MECPDIRNVSRLAVANLDPERSDQDQPGHALRALHGHLRGDPAAERAADHDGVAGVLLREQIEIEVGQVVHRVDACRLRRVAKPRM